jgi:hypothetical protein
MNVAIIDEKIEEKIKEKSFINIYLKQKSCE